ncbi:hypothetical protein BB8028_0006g03880 [Beauveria bassiana]|uniref:Uncharacterized protein n=1 Tax=Beauveria bassiana TaxID=176275 RepID=A0A2S7YIY5_BEABA|nr:hypothetical protein BB8028_0006g03880 [Beauveria bassiana]
MSGSYLGLPGETKLEEPTNHFFFQSHIRIFNKIPHGGHRRILPFWMQALNSTTSTGRWMRSCSESSTRPQPMLPSRLSPYRTCLCLRLLLLRPPIGLALAYSTATRQR